MNHPNCIVIVGATSSIAQHCARLWSEHQPAHMYLIGREAARLEVVAADLRVRSSRTQVTALEANFLDPDSIQSLVNRIGQEAAPDLVLIAHGSLPDQAQCQRELTAAQEALAINGISPVLFAEAFAEQMERANAGTLVIIGSVAGDRGRKSNYVYGAAKGLVSRYAQGLQHRLAKTEVKVVLVKPGPTDTPMTAHLKQTGARLASVEQVARDIVKGAERGQPTVYAPGKWALIMWVIRHLPRQVFNRMDI